MVGGVVEEGIWPGLALFGGALACIFDGTIVLGEVSDLRLTI
jgi:hypothetical protein